MVRGRALCFALSAAVFFFARPVHAGDNPAEAQIAELEKTNGPRIGIAAIDSKSGQRIEHRSNERFPMCSTFKLLAVATVLQRVDQGKEKLDRFVAYGEILSALAFVE